MSSDSSDKKDASVLGKLDKVADSLELTSVQLSGVVTQQQLDVLRERVSASENDVATLKTGYEILIKRSAAHADEAETGIEALIDEHASLERDFSGLRALVITSFVLGTITLIGLIVVSI